MKTIVSNLKDESSMNIASGLSGEIELERYYRLFDELYTMNAIRWKRYLHSVFRNHSAVDDCFQNFLEALWKLIVKWKITVITENLHRYAFGILKLELPRYLKRYKRHEGRFVELEPDAAFAEIAESDYDEELVSQLLEIEIKKLESKDQYLLRVYLECDLSVVETVRALGLNTTPTTSKRLTFIIEKLKHNLFISLDIEYGKATEKQSPVLPTTLSASITLYQGLMQSLDSIVIKKKKNYYRRFLSEFTAFLSKDYCDLTLSNLTADACIKMLTEFRELKGHEKFLRVVQVVSKLYDFLIVRGLVKTNLLRDAYYTLTPPKRNMQNVSTDEKVKIVRGWIKEGHDRKTLIQLFQQTFKTSRASASGSLSDITNIIEATGTDLKNNRKRTDKYQERISWIRVKLSEHKERLVTGSSFSRSAFFTTLIKEEFPYISKNQACLDFKSALKIEGTEFEKEVHFSIRRDIIYNWLKEGYSRSACNHKAVEEFNISLFVAKNDVTVSYKKFCLDVHGPLYKTRNQIRKDRLEKAKELFLRGLERTEVAKFLQSEYSYCESGAYRIANDAMALIRSEQTA